MMHGKWSDQRREALTELSIHPSFHPPTTLEQGVQFLNTARGGAAVSTAPLASEGMPFGSAGGELFAVGFGGGSVALYDARCRAGGGVVAGFVTRHRWLERVRSAGPLLMASYGR